MASVSVRPGSGALYFDFRYQGERCREYTKLEDTLENRKKMAAVLKRIEAEIELGSFDYARYFPNSPKAERFAGANGQAARVTSPGESNVLFGDFAMTWKREKAVEWRASYLASVESIFNAHLLPALKDTPITSIDRARVMSLRAQLADKKIGCGAGNVDRKITATTVNRILGILRMIMDEAGLRHGVPNPFLKLKRLKEKKTDIFPFSIDEVRKITVRSGTISATT